MQSHCTACAHAGLETDIADTRYCMILQWTQLKKLQKSVVMDLDRHLLE